MFDTLRDWLERRRRAYELAVAIDRNARRLNDVPESTLLYSGDVTAVLESADLLIRRYTLAQASPPAAPAGGAATGPEIISPASVPAEATPASPPPPELAAITQAPSPVSATPAAPAQPGADPELSATARELIKLRDWVLLNRSGGMATNEVLDGLYQGLGRILTKEGVTTIEADGPFDHNRQMWAQTEPTDNPELDSIVVDTVRPGYSFAGRIVRPQEVIVYGYAGSPTA